MMADNNQIAFNTYVPTAQYNLIYVYAIHDSDHEGILKIGKASFNSIKSESQLPPNCPELIAAAKDRIDDQTKTALVKYDLLYTELAIKHFTMADGTKMAQAFVDTDVHDVLYYSRYRSVKFMESGKQSEWFYVDLETVKRAITAVKEGRSILLPKDNSNSQPDSGITETDVQVKSEASITLRDEQADCVNKTIACFRKSKTMLWDCKMRFGKTVTAYELIRLQIKKFRRVIVITHRPAVEDGWDSDHDLIFGKDSGHIFIDKSRGSEDTFDENIDSRNNKQLYELVSQNIPFTYFASIQDLRGSKRVGGKHKKNEGVYDLDWDLVIIDEAHEGTKTPLGEKVISGLIKENTKCLQLSGTPYNLIGEFEDNIYSWTYVDEQKAKEEWEINHPGEKNPYAELPRMNILTFDLNNALSDSYLYETVDSAFNFREFFRVWTGEKEKDFRPIPEGAKIGDFVHEKDVDAFLNLITTDNPNTNYPFSTEEKRDMFRHTFWLVPGVKEAKALCALLRKHPVFKNYYPVNVAGEGDEEVAYDTALGAVREAIANKDYTITVSCGRLTTGVTVREWTAAMMLSGSSKTTASGYMQAIFRVQSPGCVKGKQKENVYVFDFAPDRALSVIGEVHSLKKGDSNPKINSDSGRVALGEFLNFCPVLAVEGTVMRPYDVGTMMRQIKKISIEAAINSGFDDDIVFDKNAGIVFKDDDEEIFKRLGDIVVPQKKSKKSKGITIADNGLTDEERALAEQAEKKKKGKGKDKRPLTDEEKAALEKLKKQREEQKKLFNLLRAIVIRLPLLFYGADADITEAITLEKFVEIVDDESWQEFMPERLQKDFFLQLTKYFDKDIVEGAGLRIRRIAKAADELPPTQRAKRIVEILSTFRNPDKETVLTPWRVVNMHLSDTIGGYCFYNEDFTQEIAEPRLVEQEETTSDIFLNPDVKVLEMNSKSGLYPLYMAFGIYMLLVNGKEDDISFEQSQEIWNRTISEHIFVLCKTKMAKSITKRTLVGYTNQPINAIYLTKLLDRMQNQERLARKLTNPSTWGKEGERMRFDAIVGNPPYQLTGGSGGSNDSPIYQHFCFLANSISPKFTSFIIPSRWFSAGRENLLGEFRKYMLNNNSLQTLKTFTDSKDLFSTVEIKGGLCYFLINTDYHGKCSYTIKNGNKIQHSERQLNDFDVLIRDPALAKIVKKVSSKASSNSLMVNSIVSNDTPFGIGSNVSESKKSSIETFETLTAEHNTILFYIDNSKRYTCYIKRQSINKNASDIDTFKVFIPGSGGSGNDDIVLGKPEYGGKNSVCSQSYLYAAFSTEVEAKNFIKYISTRFFRALVASIKISQSAPQRVYRFVPMQDYTLKSDIPWDKSVIEIDNYLFNKYDLDEEDIRYITDSFRLWKDEIDYSEKNVEHSVENHHEVSDEISEALFCSYPELVAHLLKKYGSVPGDYYVNENCKTKNKKIVRSSEGLFIHHIDEDKAIMLSRDNYAINNPYEYQKADRLVYCNYLEHLLLHVKIAEAQAMIDKWNKAELNGIGGAINFICKHLNDIYDGKELTVEWQKIAAEVVKDSFDDYIEILRYFWSVIEKNPYYSLIIRKEELCKNWENEVVSKVYEALDE